MRLRRTSEEDTGWLRTPLDRRRRDLGAVVDLDDQGILVVHPS
jgi:hypothetical protein